MQEINLSENNFEQCVKCTICTAVCPMMAVNPHYPGPKQAGPDGERYRLKDPRFYDLTLKFCLNCKRCEVACPSGVRVGDIIQTARLRYARQISPFRDHMLADTDRVGALAVPMAPVVNKALTIRPVKAALHTFMGVDKHRTFPKYASQKFTDWFKTLDQSGFKRYVSFFHGCYVNYNFPQLGKELVALLNACGFGVHLLDKEKCCGVAMISNGFGPKAKRRAEVNVKSMRKAVRGGECVLTTGSTCTFTMRDEYERLLGIDTSDIRDSLMLATKWLFDRIEEGVVKLAFKADYIKRITYHTACHMARLGWDIYSISLLRMIPGAVLTVPEQHCCGMAGTFGFKKENYPYSQMIGAELFDTLKASAPDIVATECETCKWQIEMSAGLKVMNPVSILLEALDIEKTKELNNAVR